MDKPIFYSTTKKSQEEIIKESINQNIEFLVHKIIFLTKQTEVQNKLVDKFGDLLKDFTAQINKDSPDNEKLCALQNFYDNILTETNLTNEHVENCMETWATFVSMVSLNQSIENRSLLKQQSIDSEIIDDLF